MNPPSSKLVACHNSIVEMVETRRRRAGGVKRFFDEEAGGADDDSQQDDDETELNNEYENDSFLVPSDDEEDEDFSDEDEEAHDQQPLRENEDLHVDGLKPKSTGKNTSSLTLQHRGRGRPRKNNAEINQRQQVSSQAIKEPGHFTFPVNDFSLTISKTKGDVDMTLLDSIQAFFEQYCIKGGVSTEVGHRAFNLHFQGIFRIKFPKDKASVTVLAKIFKDMIKPRTGYKILVKPFSPQQTIEAMLGYITKDDGKTFVNVRLLLICVIYYSNLFWFKILGYYYMQVKRIINFALTASLRRNSIAEDENIWQC